MESKTPEDFKKASSLLLENLESKEKSAEEGYVFTYGSLQEKTKDGSILDIDSLSWPSDDGFATDRKERLVLVARDKDTGGIVGLRLSDIRDGKLSIGADGKYVRNLDATGEILTRLRGQGIASTLDSVYTKILTRVANEYKRKYPGNHQLNWNVENRHLKRMGEIIKKSIDLEETNKREEEQKRWQALYGEGGKFNLKKTDDHNYSKIIEEDLKDETRQSKVDIKLYKEIIKKLKEIV